MHHSPHPHQIQALQNCTNPRGGHRRQNPRRRRCFSRLPIATRDLRSVQFHFLCFRFGSEILLRLNLIDKALSIIHLAQAHGFMPGVLSYNAVLDATIRSKRNISFADNVFKEMLESQVSPNVFSYNILIRGFCSAGNLDTALHFFHRMEKKGCLPNVVTYNTLIDGYCKLRRIDDGFEFLRSMALKGLEPNLISYNVVINGLCREGRMKETSLVLTEMNKKGFSLDEVTYNTLIKGYCKEGNFHQALKDTSS